jgi:hypothetical protein
MMLSYEYGQSHYDYRQSKCKLLSIEPRHVSSLVAASLYFNGEEALLEAEDLATPEWLNKRVEWTLLYWPPDRSTFEVALKEDQIVLGETVVLGSVPSMTTYFKSNRGYTIRFILSGTVLQSMYTHEEAGAATLTPLFKVHISLNTLAAMLSHSTTLL